MKFFTSDYNSIRKRLRLAGFLYIGLSVLSSIFYCSCTSGSFYTLSTGQYMLEQRLDRQFIITTECKYSQDNSQRPTIPVYQAGNKYYVAAERVTSPPNIRILSSVGSGPQGVSYVYHNRDGEKLFYEVEKSTSNGEITFTVPSGNKEDTMPIVVRAADKIPHSESTQTSVPTFTCRLDSRAAMPRLVSLPDDTPHTMAYLRGEPLFTKGKDGSRQLMLSNHEDLSWRSIYAVPSAAVLFIAVDIPFDIISFTGFCIRSIFD